jgi:hypothetical protein
VVPFVFVWGLGVPMYVLNKLRSNKDNLNKDEFQSTFGFLYSGYKYDSYWWESLIMLRKSTLIFLGTSISIRGKLLQSL